MTLLLLIACTPDAPPSPTPADAPTLTVAHVPMVPTLSWDGPDGAIIHVSGPDTSFDTAAGSPSTGIPVFGLAPATDYVLTATEPDGTELPPVDFRTPDLPDALAVSSVVATDPDASTLADGLIAMSVVAEFGSYLALADASGTWRWWLPADDGFTVASPRPTLDGTGLWLAQHEEDRAADLGIATRISWDGRDRLDVRTPRGHHMLAELPDGRLAYLAHDLLAVDDPESDGILSDRIEIVDPSLVSDSSDPYDDGSLAPEVVFDFFDTTEPWIPCSHASRVFRKWGYQGITEWTHSNSLIHDPAAGRYYLMSWHLDALLAVDDTSGEVAWQLGGRDATRAFADPDDAFDHAHTTWVSEDQAWVFDNRVHAEATSRLIRYDLTTDPVVATDVILEAKDRHVGFLGDVRPAPGGHVLGGWTIPGDVVEYDADGQELLRIKLGPGSVLGRFDYVPRPW